MFRIQSVVLSSVLTILLASCSEAPTSPTASGDLSSEFRGAAAQAVTASTTCTVSTTPEFTATLTWSKLPVARVVLWHSLLVRSYTRTLNHSTRNGSFTIQMDFEPVLAVFYNREGLELARKSCS
jgi:hypothetical protein